MKITKRIVSALFALTLVVATFAATPGMTVEAAKAKTTTKTAAAAGPAVTVASVVIQGNDVVIASSGAAASEDGVYHLIASDAYQNAPEGTEVAQAPAAAAASFSVPLNKGAANSMLYKKFTVCVVSGGALKAVSNSMYITNPEACAPMAANRMDNGKKGVLPELLKSIADRNQPADLGAKQVNINLPLSQINRLAGFDYSVAKYNKLGMQVNMIIWADGAANPVYINPYSADGMGQHSLYGLNAFNADGCKALADAATLLASHYNGRNGCGQVDNFIIGNEVNAWWLWNYMNCGSNDVFINEYYKAFRIMYNGIKSSNASANVYTCIDHQWSRAEASYYISGKEFVTKFNAKVATEGNIDWRLAVHPYNAPLYAPSAWETSKNVTHSANTAYVTMANLEVLTDFMCTPEMLSPTGAVRTVKCSEVAYISHQGEQLQAADVVYAYLAAEANRYVDGIVLRETDHASELAQGLSFGICNTDGSHKMAYDFYKNATDPNYIAQASAIAGVDLTSLVVSR